MIRIFSKLHQWTTGWFMVFFIRKYFYKLLTYIWLNLTSFISSSAGWNSQVRFIWFVVRQRIMGVSSYFHAGKRGLINILLVA
jgi:hypothetical protein